MDARDESGWTPLHREVIDPVFDLEGFPEETNRALARSRALIEALIAAGANIEARDERGNTPLHLAARPPSDYWRNVSDYVPHFGHAIEALLNGGANASARNAAGQTPWELAQANEALRGSDGYWRLNDARFNDPRQESWRPNTTTRPSDRQAVATEQAGRQGPMCEIPGYPNPANVQGLELNWCRSNVGFQRRAFALQAAGASCAIAEGTSSTPEQVHARHQEISAACEALDALGTRGGPPCRCPAGYRP